MSDNAQSDAASLRFLSIDVPIGSLAEVRVDDRIVWGKALLTTEDARAASAAVDATCAVAIALGARTRVFYRCTGPVVIPIT